VPQRNIKILVSLTLVIGAVLVLIVTNTSRSGYTTDYYHTPSEFLEKAELYVNMSVRVNGKVVAGSILRGTSSDEVGLPVVDFTLGDSLRTLDVRYVGTAVPDAFRDGADVVVEGDYLPEGRIDAKQLLVKCPSKYEALPAADSPHESE
jgi:cytochrome c-type biogenesis protein CcmE